MRAIFVSTSIFVVLAIVILSLFWLPARWLLLIVGPIVAIGVYDMFQAKHSVWRNFLVVGRGRWFAEKLRPPIRQYFVEGDLDGAPINRMFRSVVYQRAKDVRDTVPFGTRTDVYRVGYEWIGHSLTSVSGSEEHGEHRVLVGGADCTQPYSASIFNISAMSFGSLSSAAVLALNGGAKKGNFAHNTGEGGISPYHLEPGGDLIWQVGTGYFGCRTKDGNFCATSFAEKASIDNVKMIEVKLSQGAKPGHGGILPAGKNTPEIAAIRNVEPGTRVDSPPTHSAFSSPRGLLEFVGELRELSGGKPIGFKFCVGRPEEFFAICKAMKETGIKPDFITVDGGEGGTGAAPLEYSNSIGMPLREGLAFVVDCLAGFDLKRDIKVIAGGKIFSGFHLIKNMALGADLCYSARGMMLALGCIQALECHANTCPTGVATQDPRFTPGLVVSDKRERVANYHYGTVRTVEEILNSVGLNQASQLHRQHIYRRISATEIATYEDIFPTVEPGAFNNGRCPEKYISYAQLTSPDSFIVDERRVCIL